MQHWRRPPTDGAEFWISCKRPTFVSSFRHLQVIQKKCPWCSAAAYVTAGFRNIQKLFRSNQLTIHLCRPALNIWISENLKFWNSEYLDNYFALKLDFRVFVIRMWHRHQQMVDGAEFWINFKWLKARVCYWWSWITKGCIAWLCQGFDFYEVKKKIKVSFFKKKIEILLHF